MFLDALDSKTFDVTLMITLLRNLTKLYSCQGDYDILPPPYVTTPTSDLARIKYYRNKLAHVDEGKLDDSTFITAWNDITSVSTLEYIFVIPYWSIAFDYNLSIIY